MKNSKAVSGLRIMALLILLNAVPDYLFAQYTVKDVFEGREMVYYGLDFTRARFLGRLDQGFGIDPATEFELVNKYIPKWNLLVGQEPDRFDLKNAFWKSSIYYDLKPVEKKNAEIDPSTLISFNEHSITPVQIEAMISSYPEGEKKEGLGMVFIVETFDKNKERATYFVTFFDIQTKNVLFCQPISGAPSGAGLTNYWAGALKRVLSELREYRWKQWKSRYQK